MLEPMTLDSLFARYQRVRLPSPETTSQIEVALRSLRSTLPTANDVEGFDTDDVLLWRDHLLHNRKVSFSTWNNYLRHVKLLVNFGHESKILPSAINPFAGVKRIQEYRRTPKLLADAGVSTLVELLQSEEGSMQFYPGWFWLSAIRCLYYTGMRRKQLVGLVWGDIDLGGQVILLRAESSKTKREWVIPIVPPLVMELRAVQEATENRLGRRVLPSEQVFCVQRFSTSYKGKVTTVGQVSGFFRRLKENTGVVVSPHRFRHTLGTKVAKTGKIRDLQQMLGHTDVRTTLGYVQPDVEVMRDMLGVMGNI